MGPSVHSPRVAYQLAALIRTELRRQKITQAAFAKRVGVTEKHLSRVLNGRNTAHPDTLDVWIRTLGYRFKVTLEPY